MDNLKSIMLAHVGGETGDFLIKDKHRPLKPRLEAQLCPSPWKASKVGLTVSVNTSFAAILLSHILIPTIAGGC